MLDTFLAHSAEVMAHPTSLFTLLGILLLILAFLITTYKIHYKHVGLYTALMLALTIVLHQLRLYHMPQGSSILLCYGTLSSLHIAMVLVLSCLAGFLYGMLNLLQDPFIVHRCKYFLTIHCLIWY